MEGLHHCGALRELWLHDNNITTVTGVQSLVHLQVIFTVRRSNDDPCFAGHSGSCCACESRAVLCCAVLRLFRLADL